MYYQTGSEIAELAELPITPPVALRSLHDRILDYLEAANHGERPTLGDFFQGDIVPPISNPMIDLPEGAVIEVLAEYGDKIVERADLLSTADDEIHVRISTHGRLSREMFAMEHSLAIDLGRADQSHLLQEREALARMTLSVASFWTNREKLLDMDRPGGHPLLGTRPEDPIGQALFDFAEAAFCAFVNKSAEIVIIDLRSNLSLS